MVCCFTGHRHIPVGEVADIRSRLLETIEALVKQGVTEFRAGGALGFDTMAAMAVLQVRDKYPDISLVLILPCKDQDKSWREVDKLRYQEIIAHADKVQVLAEHYYRGCMFVRNRALVDGSDFCIAFLRENAGGTKMTVTYAEKQHLQIINLGE